tara:strand:+ start:1928 stop:2398 length:471 start_codon:yes stop_codon:yes gene_type:complete
MDKKVPFLIYPQWMIKSIIFFLVCCLVLISSSLFSDTNEPVSIIVEKQIQPQKITVTATMYEPVSTQTDSTPNITADGTRINVKYAGKYRYLAVSRDLLDVVSYGDYVVVEGINGKYDGVWQVKDTMHPRWENRIDLLCNPGTKQFKKDSAILTIY